MSFFHDFKRFISRGNAIDMAVGIILGASFTKVVDVLVNNVFLPPLGILIGGIDFSSFKIPLQRATETASQITMDCGLLINALINFFVVGVAVFILIKILSRLSLKKNLFAKKTCTACKMEIPFEAVRCGHCTSILDTENQTTV